MKILITGSSGFIGTHLSNALTDKFSLVFQWNKHAPSSFSLENNFQIDINGQSNWSACLENVNTVVHLAGIAHNNSNDYEYINEVNVNGVINLAKQAVDSGVKRLIFISSISVFGNKNFEKFSETSSMYPQSYPAECKCKAEDALLKISEIGSLEVVIIRPALVYGYGAPGNVGMLIKLVQKVPFLPFYLCRNKRSFISIDNLVDFISVCITHPKAKNEIFCISDGDDVSIREFTDEIAKGLCKKLVQLPIHIPIFKFLGKITGKSEQIEQLIGDLQVDSSKARRLLGWTPPTTMSETFSKLIINK